MKTLIAKAILTGTILTLGLSIPTTSLAQSNQTNGHRSNRCCEWIVKYRKRSRPQPIRWYSRTFTTSTAAYRFRRQKIRERYQTKQTSYTRSTYYVSYRVPLVGKWQVRSFTSASSASRFEAQKRRELNEVKRRATTRRYYRVYYHRPGGHTNHRWYSRCYHGHHAYQDAYRFKRTMQSRGYETHMYSANRR